MANYYESFDSYTAGAGLPAGWTSRWDGGTWSIVDAGGGEKYLRQVDTSANRRVASYDTVDSDANRDNVEILAEVMTASVSVVTAQVGVGGRMTGTSTTENGYVCWVFGDELAIYKYVSATATQLAVTTTLTLAANTKYMMRFRINGSALKARIWLSTDNEPGTWTLEVTDTAITGTGWAGCTGFSYTSGLPDDNHDFYRFAAATNGDTASFSTTQTLSPALFENANAFYAPTVSPGAVTLSPGLYANSNTFYAPTVTQGAATQELLPSLLTNDNTFYSPTITVGVTTLEPALLVNQNTFYKATVTGGEIVAPTGGGIGHAGFSRLIIVEVDGEEFRVPESQLKAFLAALRETVEEAPLRITKKRKKEAPKPVEVKIVHVPKEIKPYVALEIDRTAEILNKIVHNAFIEYMQELDDEEALLLLL